LPSPLSNDTQEILSTGFIGSPASACAESEAAQTANNNPKQADLNVKRFIGFSPMKMFMEISRNFCSALKPLAYLLFGLF